MHEKLMACAEPLADGVCEKLEARKAGTGIGFGKTGRMLASPRFAQTARFRRATLRLQTDNDGVKTQ
jgi:hypothetical protein